jgi:hypothetical protein
MGLYEFVNYVVYDNPVSKGVKSLVVPNTVPTIPPQTVTVITETKPLWKLASENGPFVRLAGLFGASAVALGAYGAHRSYPKDRADELKPIFETGNRYHFLHTLALLGIPLCKNPKLVCLFFCENNFSRLYFTEWIINHIGNNTFFRGMLLSCVYWG